MNKRTVMRRRAKQKRRVARLLFVVCCITCFLCGFKFRGTQTIARADSQVSNDEDKSEPIFQGEPKADPSFPAESKAPREKYYTSIVVEAGDSLYDIACEYITDEYESIDQYISELKKINGMIGNQLRQGDYLTIPYYL